MILSGSLHSIWLSNFFKNTDKNVQFSTGRMTIRSKLKMNTSGQQFIMCLLRYPWGGCLVEVLQDKFFNSNYVSVHSSSILQ